MYIPPYKLNDKILNYVTLITKELTKLEVNADLKKDIYLRKTSKIKSVNSSCAIEANTLSEDEVVNIINGKYVLAPPKEVKEVLNAYEAYNNIAIYKPYSIKSFLKAHNTLTKDLIVEYGMFRKNDVAVYENSNVIHIGARPEFIYEQIKSLFIWAKESDLNELVKSSIIHFEIEFIHPFSDGNGRIGRLWQSLILYKYNKLFEYVPVETLIYEHQQEYYNAIAQAEKEAESTVFIEFILEMILKTIESINYVDYLKNIKNKYLISLTNMEQTVLNSLIDYYEKNQLINNEIAVNLLNRSSASVRKYLKKFSTLDILIPIGENKGRKYKLNKQILLEHLKDEDN